MKDIDAHYDVQEKRIQKIRAIKMEVKELLEHAIERFPQSSLLMLHASNYLFSVQMIFNAYTYLDLPSGKYVPTACM